MRVYIDNDHINLLQSVVSASTMISSLAAIAKNYIQSKFPKDYFKSIYIDTADAASQQDARSDYNSLANKVPYPSMSISPEISLDDPIGGMEKGMHLASPNLYLRRDPGRYYKKLVIDPDCDFAIYYTGDYITTNFNFKITTTSFVQNADLAFFLKSKFQKDFFQYLNEQYLQTEIPKSFIKMIADLKNWDLTNASHMDQLRLYLIGTNMQSENIQKRKSLTTGKDCFFINNKNNILTLFTDLDCPPSIIRTSQIEDEYTVTFRLQMSTYLTNAFILSISKDALQSLCKDTIDSMEDESSQQESGMISISIFKKDLLSKKSVINFVDNYGDEQVGHLIYDEKYIYTMNEEIPTLYLMKEMKDEFKLVHSYAKDFLNVDLSTLIHVDVYSSIGRISKDYYSVDLDTLSVKFSKAIKDDIAVAVYLNRLAFESFKKAMITDRNYFNSNHLTNIIANIAGDDVNIVVKSFKNKDEESSIRIATSLRINTVYGVGYISLLDDDNTNDAYKICVGVSDTGEPIIKQFETV